MHEEDVVVEESSDENAENLEKGTDIENNSNENQE